MYKNTFNMPPRMARRAAPQAPRANHDDHGRSEPHAPHATAEKTSVIINRPTQTRFVPVGNRHQGHE